METLRENAVYSGQWSFQIRHAIGKSLNVGCNTDGGTFGKRGAVNVDLSLIDEASGRPIPAAVLADARSLPFCAASFDTVVLGELLEHFESWDAVKALLEAKRAMRAGGRVVITLPHDDRRADEQGYGPLWNKPYAAGVPRYHAREISRIELFDWIREAGLRIALWARIEYIWGKSGTGVVAC